MRKSATFFAGLAIVLAASACNSYDSATYSASLVQAPGVTTAATGTFNATVEGPVVHYGLSIGGGGLLEITEATVNNNSGGKVVYLYDGPTTSATTPFTGPLPTAGSFIAETITACTPGCASGRSFNNTVSGFAAGTYYVNVATSANPTGAIRGTVQ